MVGNNLELLVYLGVVLWFLGIRFLIGVVVVKIWSKRNLIRVFFRGVERIIIEFNGMLRKCIVNVLFEYLVWSW